MAGGDVADALAWLRGQQPEMERVLRDLVLARSWTFDPAGGRRVGAILREVFATGHLGCEIVPSEAFADHLVLRTDAPGAPVAIVGHLDTVFPPGTFEGFREDGAVLRGPGVLDMKGGLVVAGFALLALAHARLLQRIPLRFVIVADEEVGSPEGRDVLARHCAGARAGLVLEAGRARDAIITRRKGTGSIAAIATGRAAHAGVFHEKGVNAIWALARFVDLAQRRTDYARGITVNVGRIEGGIGKNTVPEHAEAGLDFRFVEQADGDALVASLREDAAAAAASVTGSGVDLHVGPLRGPLVRTDASGALAASYAACAREEGLGGDEAALIGGGSDASTLHALGVPAIDGLGPRGRAFHTKDEQVERGSLVPKAAALVRWLAATLPTPVSIS